MAKALIGAEEMQRKIAALDKPFLSKVLRVHMRNAAKQIQGQLLSAAPVRDGQTRNAIKVRAGKKKKGHITMLIVMAKESFVDKFYVAFVNWGTKFIKGSEWADKAFEAKEAQARATIVNGIAETFKEQGK
jgi:HK97 gp10 family phage protein